MNSVTSWFSDWHPVWQALVAGLFTWGVTSLGAALVFFTRSVHRRLLDAMLGFAAGVMTAASFWSLLAPAIAIAEDRPEPAWLPAMAGFLAGGACLWAVDKSLPHLHPDLPLEQAEGPKTTWSRSVLLVLAMTLHNIPEGLAVGVRLRRVDFRSALCHDRGGDRARRGNRHAELSGRHRRCHAAQS